MQTSPSEPVARAFKSLSAFAELNRNPVLEFSAEGVLGYFNEATSVMGSTLGRTHPQEFLPEETVAIVRGCLATGQERLRVETTISSRTLTWSFFPILPHDVVHCYVRDITERKQL